MIPRKPTLARVCFRYSWSNTRARKSGFIAKKNVKIISRRYHLQLDIEAEVNALHLAHQFRASPLEGGTLLRRPCLLTVMVSVRLSCMKSRCSTSTWCDFVMTLISG